MIARCFAALNMTNIGYNYYRSGMTGFDGGGWSRIASREVPTSLTQHKTQVPTALPTLQCPWLHKPG
jgi:hypothetical protein